MSLIHRQTGIRFADAMPGHVPEAELAVLGGRAAAAAAAANNALPAEPQR